MRYRIVRFWAIAFRVQSQVVKSLVAPNWNRCLRAGSMGVIFSLALTATARAPSITTVKASSVTDTTAVLGALLAANGPDTRVWFQLSTDSSTIGAMSTPLQQAGATSGPVSVTTAVYNLAANTTYYFRALASNSAGTSVGAVGTFTTAVANFCFVLGTITLSGVGLGGVGVEFEGPCDGSVTTDASGNYGIEAPAVGSYIVTPSANGYTFIPPSVSITNCNGQVANFVASVFTPVPPPTTVVSFDGANGAAPLAGLMLANDGNFYGTTSAGGANNLGTVFRLAPSGTLTTLYSFSGGDGSNPTAALLQANDGNFYGTTDATGGGTLFRFTPPSALTTLVNVNQHATAYPAGSLIQGADGNLYGTTSGAGAFEPPVIFRSTLSGNLSTVYTFNWLTFDSPASGLLRGKDGNLYGTADGDGTTGGPGEVFGMTPAGSIIASYTFCSSPACADGQNPASALVQGTDGSFYGTTELGGAYGAGTIFKFTPAGTLTTLHSFNGGDGASPYGLLLASDGNFYGTTGGGGSELAGTIFQYTPSAVLTTLHSFTQNDGADPRSTLTQGADGSLYGTTLSGGANGQGTVFRLALPQAWPVIFPSSGLVSAASFQTGIASNSWITILGSNLSPRTDTWANAVVGGVLPTSLDGVSVSVGGQPAYVAYVSPTQINALAPNLSPGTALVTVANGSTPSEPVSSIVQTLQPALFQWGNYAVATSADYSPAVKNGAIPGLNTVPAKPGDTIILWGTGFGPTTPAMVPGMVVPSGVTYSTASPVSVAIGGVGATVLGAALTPGDAGLYQIAIQIPTGLADGDYPIVATISGAQSPSSVLITVQQ